MIVTSIYNISTAPNVAAVTPNQITMTILNYISVSPDLVVVPVIYTVSIAHNIVEYSIHIVVLSPHYIRLVANQVTWLITYRFLPQKRRLSVLECWKHFSKRWAYYRIWTTLSLPHLCLLLHYFFCCRFNLRHKFLWACRLLVYFSNGLTSYKNFILFLNIIFIHLKIILMRLKVRYTCYFSLVGFFRLVQEYRFGNFYCFSQLLFMLFIHIMLAICDS